MPSNAGRDAGCSLLGLRMQKVLRHDTNPRDPGPVPSVASFTEVLLQETDVPLHIMDTLAESGRVQRS